MKIIFGRFAVTTMARLSAVICALAALTNITHAQTTPTFSYTCADLATPVLYSGIGVPIYYIDMQAGDVLTIRMDVSDIVPGGVPIAAATTYSINIDNPGAAGIPQAVVTGPLTQNDPAWFWESRQTATATGTVDLRFTLGSGFQVVDRYYSCASAPTSSPEEAVTGFLETRGQTIATNADPTARRIVSRLQHQRKHQRSLKDAPRSGSMKDGLTNRFQFRGSGDEQRGTVRFASTEARGRQSRTDTWFEGSLTYWNSKDDDDDGHIGLFVGGVDYITRPGLLVGAMAVYDHARLDNSTLGYRVKGNGWMVGPYLGMQLSDNLFIDGRLLWGQSANKISLPGGTSGSFDTNRWLAAARLTGQWSRGPWTFMPTAQVIYFVDTSGSFTNSDEASIASVQGKVGRALVGPELRYTYVTDDALVITPRLAVKGIWQFATSKTSRDDVLSARAQAGLSVTAASGARLDAETTYDGIGSRVRHGYSGKVRLSLPLQ